MELLIYVLHGTWYTQDTGGAEILGVSEDIVPLLGKLDRIADTKARGYVEMRGHLQEERGARYYEAVDGGWRYAKFYISEHRLTVPEMEAVEISKENQKKDGMWEMWVRGAAGKG